MKHRQEHSPLNLCRKMSTSCWSQSVFSLDEETIQQICSNPDPETAFNVIVRRRRAEVKVSTLSAGQKRELVKAKDKELNTFVKYSVVEAAPRQGISPSALMKMRWVVTFKDDGSLKAPLVVQGFTDQRLGKIPTSSPTASRRSRQIFLTLAAPRGFQNHKGDVKCAFLHLTTTMRTISKLSQHNSFRHVLRTSPRVISEVAIGASSMYSIVEGRVRSCQCSKKMAPPCCD